jgi:hypothetical protein
MALRSPSQCWVCGRTAEDVRNAAGKPSSENPEIDRNLARVNESKANFARVSNNWWIGVPDQFKMMDFSFVVKNPAQFRGLAFIGEIEDARKSFVESLGEAAARVSDGEEAALGDVQVGAKEPRLKQILMEKVDGFEKRSGRALMPSGHNGTAMDASKPAGMSGLNLGDGIKFLRDAGMLYYSIEQSLLEARKEEEMKKVPPFGVASLKINGFAKGIPLCTICENLIREL